MKAEPKDIQELQFGRAALSDKEFKVLADYIYENIGIKMPPIKKTMLEARLQRRLRSLGMTNFAQYCDYIFSPKGTESELIHFIDVVTTNKTDFFREPAHFNFLTQTALPELKKTSQAGTK
ncbi:chemotaxis protein CheR, partial [Candidatus Magnetoovum chiemensis]